MKMNNSQIKKNGIFTLPMDLRIKNGVTQGDVFTLIDMGDGSLYLSPRISQVNRLGDRVAEILCEACVSLDDLLGTLDDEHERYYQEHYIEQPFGHAKKYILIITF